MNPEVLEFSFQGLKGQFMGAFANFIQRILAKESIPNIKGFLTVNYPQMIELKSVDTVQGLIDFLSIYCSFDCFGLMVEIAVRFECLEAVEVLEKFEHERHRWYAYVLAVDFVRCHAEDEDAVTNNRVKVWKQSITLQCPLDNNYNYHRQRKQEGHMSPIPHFFGQLG